MKRRDFLSRSAGTLAGLGAYSFVDHTAITALQNSISQHDEELPAALAKNENFWKEIQKVYRISPDFINLENGYYSMVADPVLEAQLAYLKDINANHSYYMRRKHNTDRIRVLEQVAALAGCSTDELLLCRNTTEALDTIILGLDLKAGEEVILTQLDYPSVVQCFKMRARRYGSVNKMINIPLDPKSDEEIVAAYEEAITPKTKVLVVTHINNFTGQILPVREIADMAHRHDVEVISDSAHAFAHVDFKIPDLDCDYFGASLHKWLGAPLGTGILYMKKEKIEKVWPLYGDDRYEDDDMRKFGHIGTIPCHNDLAIEDAIRFHQMIGGQRKEERLRYLSTYWMEKLQSHPNIQINSPSQSNRFCAIGNVRIKKLDSKELVDVLFEQYGIFTTTKLDGIRVTPHLYNSLADLDKFVAAMGEIAG